MEGEGKGALPVGRGGGFGQTFGGIVDGVEVVGQAVVFGAHQNALRVWVRAQRKHAGD